MTEAEWAACNDTRLMLQYFSSHGTNRKHWLFACACCRCVWNLLVDERSRSAVETVERFADGGATEDVLRAAFAEYYPGQVASLAISGSLQAASAVGALGWRWRWPTDQGATIRQNTGYMAARVARSVAEALAKTIPWQAARQSQSKLIREVFGNPFRPVKLYFSWLTWHAGAVRKMAQVIYNERRFADLPILADALEEAGCTDDAILSHCREPGEHVRGCWVVDLLLGKT